ncbi:MAG: formyltransferase family protein [Gaiellaceae bacterium]
MDVALLTTDTAHHAYFAAKLAGRFTLSTIVVERRIVAPPFETFHAFEAERDAYEQGSLLAGVERRLDAIARVHVVETANHALGHLREIAPDVILVFGTGKLAAETIAAGPVCLNLHGGNPEEYRGLDTHLWAIYHQDFGGLVTALHHVDAELDTGDLVDVVPIPLERDMHLYELRSRNTEVCVDLACDALDLIDTAGSAPRRPQARRGRYYSFMPAVLKDRCVRMFERHTALL